MKANLFAAALCIALAAAAPSAPAQEQTPNKYLGGSIGPTRINGLCEGQSNVTSCDNRDAALKFFFGYVVNPNLAWEFGLSQLGSARVQRTFATNTYEATALEATMVGSWPLGSRFAVYGRLGLYLAALDADENSVDSGSSSIIPLSGNFTFGAGTRFDVTDRFALRVEWQRYPGTGMRMGNGNSDLDVIWGGALFRF